jgi:hypothetical protein
MNAQKAILIFNIICNMSYGQVKTEKAPGGILFTEGGKNVLFYQIDPKSKDGKYERCNYFHPFWNLKGDLILTEDFPGDHLHQRGIYWAWHQIWIDEKRIGDGWELTDFKQEIAKTETMLRKDGAALLHTEVHWKSLLLINSEGKMIPYLKENAYIKVYPQKNNARKIDFEIRLLALADNLDIGGSEDVKGYGGFSVRMLLPDDVVFSGSGGMVTPQNEAVKSEGFMNISGTFTGWRGGIIIKDHMNNPGFPQSWIIRKKNSMQNPVFPGKNRVTVSTTEPLILKYSVIVYEGEFSTKML